jgi:hypothetical protein
MLRVVVDKASIISALSQESADLYPGFWHGPVPDELSVLGHRSYSFLAYHVPQVFYFAFEEEALLWLQFESCLSKCFQDRLQCGKVFRQIYCEHRYRPDMVKPYCTGYLVTPFVQVYNTLLARYITRRACNETDRTPTGS